MLDAQDNGKVFPLSLYSSPANADDMTKQKTTTTEWDTELQSSEVWKCLTTAPWTGYTLIMFTVTHWGLTQLCQYKLEAIKTLCDMIHTLLKTCFHMWVIISHELFFLIYSFSYTYVSDVWNLIHTQGFPHWQKYVLHILYIQAVAIQMIEKSHAQKGQKQCFTVREHGYTH